MRHNKDAVSRIADVVVARREIYGDELLDLLRNAKLTEPTIDYTRRPYGPSCRAVGRGSRKPRSRDGCSEAERRARALAVTAERVGGETLPKERAVFPGRFMIGYR